MLPLFYTKNFPKNFGIVYDVFFLGGRSVRIILQKFWDGIFSKKFSKKFWANYFPEKFRVEKFSKNFPKIFSKNFLEISRQKKLVEILT